MSRRTVIAASAFAVMTCGGALAAGPNDGTWAGQCTSEGRCGGDLQVTVADGQAAGEYTAVGYEAPIKGSIAAEGTFNGILTGRYANLTLTGKFSGGSGNIVIPNSTCGIPVTCSLSRK